jgi:hypothetical protein
MEFSGVTFIFHAIVGGLVVNLQDVLELLPLRRDK